MGLDLDCGDIPDAAMTLAVMGLFTEGPMTIRNVYNWRLKVRIKVKWYIFETILNELVVLYFCI